MVDEGRGGLERSPFSYEATRDGKVFIAWRGRTVKVLAGKSASAFLVRLEGLDDLGRQLAMAKITGNFKRGNE